MVAQERTSPARVLVIDNNSDVADSFCYLLTRYGYSTLSAYDARTALEFTQLQRPNLILLDYGMTLQDAELVARLRGLSPSTRTPIIAVTGWTSPECQKRAEEMGMNAYLIKPCETEVLLQTVAGLTTGDL